MAGEEDAPAVCEMEHTSPAEGETEDTCPVGVGDAAVQDTAYYDEDVCPVAVGDETVDKNGTVCWREPELVTPYELELE